MEKAQKDYQQLHHISRHARILQGIESILHWDQETNMPSNGAGIRAEQIKTLSGIVHRERTSAKFKSALSKLIDLKTGEIQQTGLSPAQKSALKEWRRDFLHDTALPDAFVEEFAQLSSESIVIWQKAKKDNDFKSFAPHLEKIVSLCRKKADYIGYTDHPYDALLDKYEPDMTAKDVKALFNPLKKSIGALLGKIKTKKEIDDSFLKASFPISKQTSFNEELLTILQFCKENGRLDPSVHPFSSSAHPTDNRITTKYQSKMLVSNIRSVLHECGHAFYEMGLLPEQYGSPLGDAISLGVHESQSRWWETRIGLSKPFWTYCLPKLQRHFKGKLDHVPLQTFWKAINKVEPSLIRIEADEVTYGLHVILRFELELALFDGSLKVKDLPEAWNNKMKELLGVTPKTDSEGCLQDIHWSMGGFGYFPTYSLGNLYAAHLFKAFAERFTDWEKRVAKGELSFIKEWLSNEVHQYGRQYTGKEILKKATGKAFTSKAFEEYLEDKYSKIYGF